MLGPTVSTPPDPRMPSRHQERMRRVAPCLFMAWAAEGIDKGWIQLGQPGSLLLPSLPQEGAGATSRRDRSLRLVLSLGSAKRFIIGAFNGAPFLGAQDYDLIPLQEVAWTSAEAIPRDAHGTAWINLRSTPFRLLVNPNRPLSRRPLTVSIPVSATIMRKIPPFQDHPVIDVRRIRVSGDGSLEALGSKARFSILLDH